MSCITGIAKNITSDCTTHVSGGLEIEAWVFNRKEITITYSAVSGKENQITDIAMVGAATGFKITGNKKLLNAGHDLVVAEDRPNKYTHHFMFQQFEFLTEDVRNVDDIDDVVIVVESKDKNDSGDGIFRVYGAKFGLWKATDTHRDNDVNGARNIELASLGGQEEPYSRYVYLDTDHATSKAALEALLS